MYYDQKEKVGYVKSSAMLTALKKEPECNWLNDVSSVPLQQCLRHQQMAFKNFFEGRAKYPTFKKKIRKQSTEFTKSPFKYSDE
jgi:putative transposase